MEKLRKYPWKRTILKTVVLIIVLVILQAVTYHPVLNNELAMTQMENSNELFIVWDSYNRVRNVLPFVYTVIGLSYVGWIGADVYRFMKNKKERGN